MTILQKWDRDNTGNFCEENNDHNYILNQRIRAVI